MSDEHYLQEVATFMRKRLALLKAAQKKVDRERLAKRREQRFNKELRDIEKDFVL